MIVDDEPLAILAMLRLLAAHGTVRVVGTAGSMAEALQVIAAEGPDLVFLDVALGDGDGFAMLAALDPRPAIVFVTAHPDHAVRAFAVEAVDYLLKPVMPERLAVTLGRLPAALLTLNTPDRRLRVAPEAVVALCAEGDFTRVHLADQAGLLILRPLGAFEAELPAPPFLRIGRSVLVNRDRVRELRPRDRNGALLLLDGMAAPLTIGRAATARLRAALSAG